MAFVADEPKVSFLLAAGSNGSGQLGLGHEDDANILQHCRQGCGSTGFFPGEGRTIKQLSSGGNHAVAIVANLASLSSPDKPERELWVTGSNAQGQLGTCTGRDETLASWHPLATSSLVGDLKDGDNWIKWSPKLVSAGWDRTFVVLEAEGHSHIADRLIVLGNVNDFDQLGVESNDDHDLKGQDVSLPGVHRIEAVACGPRHSAVIASSGAEHFVFAWGAGRQGQCGPLPASHSGSEPDREGTIASKGAQDASKAAMDGKSRPGVISRPQVVATFKSASAPLSPENRGSPRSRPQLSAGKEHTLVLIPDEWTPVSPLSDAFTRRRNLILFGSNKKGQCDMPEAENLRILDAGCTWSATLALARETTAGEGSRDYIIGAGAGEKGQLARAPTNDEDRIPLPPPFQNASATALACGSEHALMVCESSSHSVVLGWGWNEHGNLAQGDQEDRFEPVQVWPPPCDHEAELQRLASQVQEYSQAPHVWAGCGTTFVQVSLPINSQATK